MKDPVITENANADAVSKQTKYATLTPNNPEMAEVWKPIDSALGLIATGRTDVKKHLMMRSNKSTRKLKRITPNKHQAQEAVHLSCCLHLI